MPDSKGRPLFSDFDDADAVESVLAAAPKAWRSKLVLWEYALMLAAASSAPRPTRWDLHALEQRFLRARPAMAVFVLVLCAVVAGFTTWVISLPAPPQGFRPGTPPLEILYLLPLGMALTQLVQLGKPARAMRLVWASQDRDTGARLEMLREALKLDKGLA